MSVKQRRSLIVSFDNSQFKSLVDAIKNLIKVLASTQIRREEGTERNARFLRTFGLTEYEIGNLLGVDTSTVSKALSKKKGKSVKVKKG